MVHYLVNLKSIIFELRRVSELKAPRNSRNSGVADGTQKNCESWRTNSGGTRIARECNHYEDSHAALAPFNFLHDRPSWCLIPGIKSASQRKPEVTLRAVRPGVACGAAMNQKRPKIMRYEYVKRLRHAPLERLCNTSVCFQAGN
ncbi:hypothetical protein [Paraburkholderia metrosideri]|uniref:hypothetical protein n=1 Tax=Paraburkholderia metrosideri TaxID=580937 RepID=UPI00191B4F9B|nr:hypothetical protein [Paraburkholderia metrosideri]